MLQGYQFDKMQVYPTSDASLYSFIGDERNVIIPNRGNEMKVTTNELSLTVDTGEALIQGRLVKITEPMSITVGANVNGYLVIEIDLSKANTSSGTPGQPDYAAVNNQLSLKFVTQLTQDNINNDGLLYHFNLGSVSSTTSAATFMKSEKTNALYQTLLFEGAVAPNENEVVTLSEKMTNYKILVFMMNSAPDGAPFGFAFYPVIDQSRIPKFGGQSPLFCDAPIIEEKNNISLYAGRFKNISETQIQTIYPIRNIVLRTGMEIGGGTKYYIRQIWGIR